MRILMINSRLGLGGAEIAAYRLAKALETTCSVDVRLLTRTEIGMMDVRVKTKLSVQDRYFDKAIDLISNRFGLQYQYLPFSGRRIFEYAKKFRPEIIHLHNIHGGYFPITLLSDLSRLAPIVWTAHDMWAITGHCHYPFNCERWLVGCGHCPMLRAYPAISLDTSRLLLKQKRRIYRSLDLTVVAPSDWLYRALCTSTLLPAQQIRYIPYGIDLDLFHPYRGKNGTAERYPDRIKRILYILPYDCHNKWRKGTDLLGKILIDLDRVCERRFELFVTGHKTKIDLPRLQRIKVRMLGVLNQSGMVALYQQSDLVILPSRADNLPNVLIEAISCGLPCVTFRIGGCPEIVLDRVNGFVVEPFDTATFAGRMRQLLEDPELSAEMGRNARSHAERRFCHATIARHYLDLYQSIK